MTAAELLLKFPKAFWISIGNTVSDGIRVQSNRGKDAADKTFKKYSASYAKYKKSGGVKTRGENKGRKRFPRQSSKRINPPDLKLTGDMLKNMQVIGTTEDSVTVGWAEPSDNNKAVWNAEMGRAMSTTKHPVPKKVVNAILKEFGVQIERNGKKVSETITFEI